MTAYTITSTVSTAESEREQTKRDAARAVYSELVKYIENTEGKTA